MEHVEKIITVNLNNINKLALLDMCRILPPIIVANSLFSCVVETFTKMLEVSLNTFLSMCIFVNQLNLNKKTIKTK